MTKRVYAKKDGTRGEGHSRLTKNKSNTQGRGRTVCVITNGCPENRIDGARMQEFLKSNGYALTADFRRADIVLFNSCGLTQRTQEESIAIVSHVQSQKRPSAELIVYGCLPRINSSRLREVYQGMTFGSDEIEGITRLIETSTMPDDATANYLIPRVEAPLPNGRGLRRLTKMLNPMAIRDEIIERCYRRLSNSTTVFNPHTFNIKVCTGCLSACAFCAVRLSRRRLRSKPIGKIVSEFDAGLAKGWKEFAFLGTEVGAYGRDQGTTLTALLRELLKRQGDYRIRLRNVQPSLLIKMMPEFQEILRTGKISYLSSAVESGNNRILELMRRGYEIGEYKQAINTLKSDFPNIQIRSQILVGFPGETENEFQDTLRLLDEVDFDFVEVYAFQPRPNTEAAGMENQVSPEIIRRRCQIARAKSVRIGARKELFSQDKS